MTDPDAQRRAHPLDYISPDAVQDLWGIGYTIVRRHQHPDPFHVPAEVIPHGRSYQWWHLVHDKFHFYRPENATPSGWAPVPASRHDGMFMPFGTSGAIEVNGLGLFEKSKFEIDADRAQQIDAAHKLVDGWKEKWGGQFSGDVSIGGERTPVGETKSIENTTAIPRDMVPYIAQIFIERDYLGKCYADDCKSGEPAWSSVTISEIAAKMDVAMKADATGPKWPTLNAIILPYAIANVRSRIKQEAINGD